MQRGAEHYHPHDFQDALDGLAAALINEDVYDEAAQRGIDAVYAHQKTTRASKINAYNVADLWIGHVRKYANDVPGRIAGELAQTANDALDQSDSAAAILDRIDTKLESFRSGVTRYAEPPWGAGNQGYGDELDANGVLLDWILDDVAEHCGVCPEIAAGSPYERGAIPTWPKLGDTPCRDRCYCFIRANEASWAEAFPQAA